MSPNLTSIYIDPPTPEKHQSFLRIIPSTIGNPPQNFDRDLIVEYSFQVLYSHLLIALINRVYLKLGVIKGYNSIETKGLPYILLQKEKLVTLHLLGAPL